MSQVDLEMKMEEISEKSEETSGSESNNSQESMKMLLEIMNIMSRESEGESELNNYKSASEMDDTINDSHENFNIKLELTEPNQLESTELETISPNFCDTQSRKSARFLRPRKDLSYKQFFDNDSTSTAGIVKRKRKTKLITCTICSRYFTYKLSLRKHLITTHKMSVKEADRLMQAREDQIFVCDLCNGEFTTSLGLYQHKTRAHGSTEFKDNKAVHSDGHNPDKNPNIITYIVKRHPKMPTVYDCIVCGRNFRDVTNVLRHQTTYYRERNFVCNLCDVGFWHHKLLEEHMHMHESGSIGPVECDICHYTFKNNNRIVDHNASFHITGPIHKKYECLNCGKKYEAKGSWLSHTRICGKTFICKYCGKTLQSPIAKINHMRKHTGERVCRVKLAESR